MSSEDLPLANWPIGIIGGGRMGVAIAYLFLAAGHDVTLVEPAAPRRDAVRAELLAITELLGTSWDPKRFRISPALSSVAHAMLVIEAVPENLSLKQRIFAELAVLCSEATILATNTSVIPIKDIGALVPDASRVVGTHFWNPPYKVRLVEVIQSEHTALATVEKMMWLLNRIGQKPVHVRKDVPGFIGNRMQHALKREAIALVQNGVCDAETVDFVIKNSFGSRLGLMGTLEQSDLVGLNLTLDIHEIILRDLDRSTEPQPLLVNLVRAGKLGIKTGEGFRHWSPDEAKELAGRLNNLPDKPKTPK
jgi:3-hydroxybutyryl-CoA dehydrogenase